MRRDAVDVDYEGDSDEQIVGPSRSTAIVIG